MGLCRCSIAGERQVKATKSRVNTHASINALDVVKGPGGAVPLPLCLDALLALGDFREGLEAGLVAARLNLCLLVHRFTVSLLRAEKRKEERKRAGMGARGGGVHRVEMSRRRKESIQARLGEPVSVGRGTNHVL